MAIAAGLILCTLSVLRGFEGKTFMGRALGGDFVQFYVAGKILNEYEPARLYDLDLEVRLQHEASPATPKDQMLVFASAPWIAAVFRPFALLPYRWAYLSWLAFSLVAYSAAALLLLFSAGLTREQTKTGFLLAISSMPFLLETWIGGQISVLGFLAIALFVFCRARERTFLAGLALAGALFKPTLVAIPVLMLAISIRSAKQWKMLAGFAAGAVALATMSLRIVGIQGCLGWIEALRFYGNLANSPVAAFRRTKYVDLGSFFHLMLPGAFTLAQFLIISIAAVGLLALALTWRQSSRWRDTSQDLLWAATFAAALVLNVYTPIYDTILAGAAVALAARTILKRTGSEVFQAWLVAIYLVPWLTQSFAEFLHFQPYTLVLAGFAAWLARSARSEFHSNSSAIEAAAQRPLVSPDAYAVSGSTDNYRQRLGVLLRSYWPTAP